ncbi:MAG: hypothetical protein WBH00_03990 [Xanthobacteraceae bacterium]
MADHAIGLVPLHPKRVPHFCNDMTRQIHVGDGAYMSIVNPWKDSGLEWQLCYGGYEVVKYVAASVVDSYDYLLSSDISMTEAIRRLRIMRAARKQLRPTLPDSERP